jgi:two-component system sensor histidine kinase YesM
MIPPFIVHTFVENILKHAVTFDKKVNIFIKAELVEIVDNAYIRLIIEDDGKGMTEEVIKQVNNDRKSKDDGMSIGIWNIKQTLKLIYSDRAKVVVSNSDLSGTMIEIIIPVEGNR